MKEMIVFLLVLATSVWSAEVEDLEFGGPYRARTMYATSSDGYLLHREERYDWPLNDIYMCCQEFIRTNRPDSKTLDFDKLATTYVKCSLYPPSRYFDDRIKWIELYGNKEELEKNQLSSLRVNLKMKDVSFSNKNTPTNNKVALFIRKFNDNSQSERDSSLKIEHKLDKVTTTTTERTHSFSSSVSVESGFKDPTTKSGASIKINLFKNSKFGKTNSNSDKVSYTLTDINNIAAHKLGRVIWTKSTNDVKMDWSAYIEASGWIAAKADNHILFYPVILMSYVFSDYVTRLGENTIGLKVTGTLEMKDAVVSDTVIDEYDISKTELNCPTELTNYTSESLIS